MERLKNIRTRGDLVEFLNFLVRDGRFIRLTIVGIVGLLLAIYVATRTGVLGASKESGLMSPTPIVVKPMKALETGTNSGFMVPGEMVEAEVDGILSVWQFPAGAGDAIDVMIRPHGDWDDDFDLVVELFTPSGQKLVELNQYGAGKPEFMQSQFLPENGDYALYISSTDFSHKGGFQLHLLNQNVKSAYPMQFGIDTMVRGETTNEPIQFWVFAGAADTDVALSLIPYDFYNETRFLPFIKLYAPNGELLADVESTVAGEPIVVRNINLPVDGPYTIWVGEQGFDDQGRFVLTVTHEGEKTERILRERER